MDMRALRARMGSSYKQASSEVRQLQKSLLENSSEEEIWKPIAGWEGLYEVSNHGRIRGKKLLRSYLNRTRFGYCRVWGRRRAEDR